MILPFVRELFADVENLPAFSRVATHLKAATGRIRVSGLTPPAQLLVSSLFPHALNRPVILIVADNKTAELMLPQVQAFCELSGTVSPDAVVLLPAYDVLPFENMSPHPEIQEARARALWKVTTGAARIVIIPAGAALMKLHAPEFYFDSAQVFRRGETVDVDKLVAHLNTVGYTKTDVVEMPGEYALRGGILDVYPPEADRPLRVEFFGDEVESVRKFDPGTQRSSTEVDEVQLLPLTDTPVREDTLAMIGARLSGERLGGSEEDIEEAIRSTGVAVFPGWELYSPVAGAGQSIFDLMGNAAVVLSEPTAIKAELDHWWERVNAAHERSGVGSLVRPEDLYTPPDDWWNTLGDMPAADLEQLGIASFETEEVAFGSRPTTKFHGSIPGVVEEVRKLTGENQRVMFAAGSTGEVERLAEVFTEYGVTFRLGSRTPRPGETFIDDAAYLAGEEVSTIIVKAFVPDGLVLPEARLVIFGTYDLFDESEVAAARPLKQKSKTSAFVSDFRDLAIGDYVVHVEHGIGQYQGLKEIPQADGSKAEFMVLEYAEGARLYVPLTRLDLVQKYRSAEGARPVLNRLGTAQWQKTKARVKKAMRDMAEELLKLYAQRKLAPGHSYPTDTEWQREFEDAFEFSETDDQISAISDIKNDMQASTPMDRLLCGDVGYGKTEVAMRAAFKAVSDNRQVAVLAPTTVLVFQHFETFKRRFAQFPIRIEMLSRFRSAKEQKEIVDKIENGKVDIVVGTHRLLSKDVKFSDLGLVIVDEEQRFGVAHKEKLKQMRKEVDVLTMSATPIPRTMHMAMVGLRDMSVIETPPKDRMAIQTVVAPWDEKVLRNAIEHELDRGGQVYFIHNRVESIYEIAAKLQELVPKARILVGHGQMTERELEKVMLGFMRHEADILVATTIVENGLDIPLCNTIIINRADRHGLSELYQLRGRVGRSNRRAYAYLLIPADTELSPIARRRLAALKEFSDLGAGFKIAALDLELRGAGNLLGGEQSGHIDAIGFEMYTSMLERTVRELKGEVEAEEAEVALNLGLNIRIPADYITEENQRLRMYKRVAGVETEKQLEDVTAELADRYGEPPAPVRTLLEYATLKLLCRRLNVVGIDRHRDTVSIKFGENAGIDPEKLMRFVATKKGANFSPQGVLKYTLAVSGAEQVLGNLRNLLQSLAGQQQPVSAK
ncbi:MAG TPA: transcription-repair coupling factor [Terriglobales bacterium]|nr:transcription-repair coupling factor [Terriglobales bacterium]